MDKARLFGVSFLLLFLELTLIRWIPANIRLIGYFSNLVLLASFFGMGIGLLWHSSRRRLFPWMPAALLLLLLVVASFRVDINVASPNAVFFKGLGDHDLPVVDPVAILPMLFFLISAVFVIVGQEFGRLFSHLPALVAYTWDIAGSLSGIVLFTLSAWLSTPAWIWFIIIVLVYLWLLNKRKHTALVPALLAGFAVILLTYLASRNSIWSPYYKINVQHMLTGYNVDVNNISNQYVTHWENKEGFYRLPYQSFRDNTFKKILVIGSGTGSDVAVALALDPTVEHIDAVEIDPSVADLGRKLNPDRPYDDPRVRLIITDGRNYLERSHERYDAIIFALTDSLVLISQTTNVRLESFVYTKESFEQAKKHLTDRGVFILYNYYRKTWLVDKLAGMLQDVFQQNPISYSVGEAAKLAVLMVGPRINDLSPSATLIPYTIQHTETPATDNWPFLYLRGPNIPALYTHFLLVILAIIFIVTTGTLLYKRSRFDLRFFLFGAAFLLLETKNLVTFGLLFGSTWQVNAVVFAVILLSVLSANLLSMHFTIRPTWILYLALGTSIGVAALLPKSFLLSLPELTRYTVASVIYFAPVVFANLIFSQLFGKSHDPTVSLGSNILGAVIGGLLEYSSLTFGYNTLYIIIALCYMLAFFLPSNTFFYATSQRH